MRTVFAFVPVLIVATRTASADPPAAHDVAPIGGLAGIGLRFYY